MKRRKPDYGVLFDKFGDGRRRPALRRGRRCEYQIPPDCRLPTLARLLEIDSQAEAAAQVAQQRERGRPP